MLSGTAAANAHAEGAPTLASFDTPATSLGESEILQVLYEFKASAAEAILPPGLHPTIPGVVTWLAWSCPDSPWGPMRMVQTRIECRSGNRPRAMLVAGVCDNEEARAALAEGFGFRLLAGEIEFRRGYDGADLSVRSQGREILSLELRDPTLLPAEVVQFVSGMHPAHTPNGYRLVQCDMSHHATRSERVRPRLLGFDGEAWGDARIEPHHPVAAAVCLGEIELPALRFVCKPDELAFVGTEKVGAATA